MQLNVLDDLAEAMKALDGKKCLTVNSIGPHAIASFLHRGLLEMDMAHAIPVQF